MLLSNSQKKNNENDNDSFKEINQLKNEIKEKENEIQQIKMSLGNNDNLLFQNLKDNYNSNLKNIKDTYEILIEEKNKKIEELNEENMNFEKELEELKSTLMKINNDTRKKNILTEATINKLENEKKRLTLQMEDLSESNDERKNSDNSSIITEVNTLKNENFEYKNIIDKLNK